MLKAAEQTYTPANQDFAGKPAPLPPCINHELARRLVCEELENELLNLAAQLNAANHRFLTLLARFDAHEGWHGDGIKTFAHYLNWKIGMGHVMAREKIRVARALAGLPLIDAAFARGAISYSMVRAMTRVATSANETFLMQIAETATAAHMEMLVRKYQRCRQLEMPVDEFDAWRHEKGLSWTQDETGMYVINVRLPAEEGALVIKALELIVDTQRREKREAERREAEAVCSEADAKNVSAETFCGESTTAPATPTPTPAITTKQWLMPQPQEDYICASASALTQLAERYLQAPEPTGPQHQSLGERYQIFLHVNANAASLDHKVGDADNCSLDNQHFLSRAVARRLACDASITTVLENDAGDVLNIGRRSRLVPRAMAHALRIRDRHCVFPGCCQNRHTDAHHIQHWAEGGETSLDNLVTLCRFHHTELHKGKFRLQRLPAGDLAFTNSNNEVITRAFFPQLRAPVSTIEADNRQQALQIDEHTAACQWTGEAMNVQMALAALYQQ